jgi:iron uptake system component EfeO
MRRGPVRAALLAGVVVVALVAAFALFTAIGVGGASDSVPRTATTTVPRHVSAIARYSEEVSVRERGGSATLSEEPPIDPARFTRPIRAYLRYAAVQTALMQRDVRRLRAATDRGDRGAARARWRAAFARYERLGAVYGAFGDLDRAIDGLPGGLPRGVRDPAFTGLHRVELGLWGAAGVRTLRPAVRRLAHDVRRLWRATPRARITPLDYAIRAHEILEDAQRDVLSGKDVPWSHEGVLAASSAVEATRVVIGTLRPLLAGQAALDPVLLGLSRVRARLSRIRHAHGGRLPALGGLSASERRQLNGSVSWALERLQRVPGSLETTEPIQIPRLPTP